LDIVGMDIGAYYVETCELKIVNGRDFNPDLQSDYEEAIIINERFVEFMRWESPIGKELIYQDSLHYYVIGVVKDFYFDSFESEVQPMWLRFVHPKDFRYLIARTSSAQLQEVFEEVKMAWKEVFDNSEYDIKTAEYARWSATTINTLIFKLFVLLGLVATVLSLIGLFSLVSLNIVGRTKEVGIRKVLGASITGIIGVMNKEYIYILGIGVIAGTLISYTLIPLFMGSVWAYHVPVNPIAFLLSSILLISFSLLTVGFKVANAASRNPVELLRDE